MQRPQSRLISRSAVLLGCLLSATVLRASVVVIVPSSAGPWSQSVNPAFDYGLHDNGPPVVVDSSTGFTITPGTGLSISYLHGMVAASSPGYPYYDANGVDIHPTDYVSPQYGRFPSYYTMGRSYLVQLMGAFSNDGVLIGTPMLIGNGPKTFVVPTGANQLLLGVNDNYFGDNAGAFTVSISELPQAVPEPTSAVLVSLVLLLLIAVRFLSNSGVV